MKFFSMKKPVVRILLFVVLLGLAIFYFRYMREGFQGEGGTTDATDTYAAMGASSGTFTEGSSCVVKGSAGKTIKGKTLYCCSSKWSKNTCPTPLPKDELVDDF
jgi:hypothetical protein